MTTGGSSEEDVLDPDREIAFPESVTQFFRGELGQPYGGFPKALQSKSLKGETPLTARPGSVMEDTALNQTRVEAEGKSGRHTSDRELASYLMYPQVFTDYAAHLRTYGDVSQVPTKVYFYGMEPGEAVLDPFAGSGTTGAVAQALGRDAVLIDANPEAIAVMRTRMPLAMIVEN